MNQLRLRAFHMTLALTLLVAAGVSGFAQTGTPAGTYTITVTATSGSTTANTTVTLVVN